MASRSLSGNEIRDRFIELRERLGWTQTDAARELEVPQPSVSQWERLERPIPEKHRREIAHRAGEPETYLKVMDPLDGARPRRDRLIVAAWMAAEAARLRAEVTERPEDDLAVDAAAAALGDKEITVSTRTGA
jgi:transcriptional regulator with XRE-family HTH domain